jgi:L-cysteine:1D-myo-inositol 2-amino-2-deoxy-alpha-D-glucopyranoside ligase
MKLYNSLSQTKEPFIPLKDKQVRMYVCGITPYDTTHLGHAFTYLTFDVLQRYLTSLGYHVTYIQNVTDIDDDILKKAKETNRNWQELGEWWTQKFLTDLKALNLILPTHYVKATKSIPTIITLITKLLTDDFAYQKNGNIYFRVNKTPDYGKLSKYTREKMITLSKERGADPADPNKEDPLDFLLWQQSQSGEPQWSTPFGSGRPGWHIECSAMIYKYLGKNIDIHGGGHDLIYPHHESEIAQSEAFTKEKPFVKYWMHTGMLAYQGEKMSKSLGNLVMVSELLKKYSNNAIRYLLLSHHYRTAWEFTESAIQTAEKQTEILKKALQQKPIEQGSNKQHTLKQYLTALEDDLDTPQILTLIQRLANKELHQQTNEGQHVLRELTNILGFVF